MPYTSPAAIVTGTTISKTTFGDVVKADLDYLANPPSCRVIQAAAQSIPNATETAITFTVESYDTDTMHDTVTNNSRITIKTAGLYQISATLPYAGGVSAGTRREAFIRKNGTGEYLALATTTSIVGVGSYLSLSAIAKFVVNDYIELRANQQDGAALNTLFASPTISCVLAATWIGLG